MVRQVYFAMTGKFPGEASAVKVEPSAIKVEASAVKVEPPWSVKKDALTPVNLESGKLKAEHCQVKAELCQVKQELAGQSGISCLISPAKILQLYQGNFSAADTPRRHLKVDLHV